MSFLNDIPDAPTEKLLYVLENVENYFKGASAIVKLDVSKMTQTW
jgi:hypothetical protein